MEESQDSDLSTLEHRLRTIVTQYYHDNDEAPLKIEEAQIDQSPPRQSHAAAAEKALNVPEELHHELDEDIEHNGSPPDDEGEYAVRIIGRRLYIDDELILPSPTWSHSNTSSDPDSPDLEVLAERNQMMAIGYVLGPQSNVTNEQDMEDDEDDYPEAFALDDDELPTSSQRYYNTDKLADTDQGRMIFGWVLYILGLGEWIEISEIADIWTYLLEPGQRIQIMRQLNEINFTKDEVQALTILRSSTISEMIHEWAAFKLTAFQRRAQGVPITCSAKATMYSLLQYCITLEELIDEGHQTTIPVQDVLRRPPRDRSSITMNAPIGDLIEALTQRVKCRTVHERWVQFTNILVLKEARAYILDLKGVVRAICSLELQGPEWYHMLALDRD
ncbi:hypothetical protein P7C71_g2383, partial [Lecanoromycetidae sp. Uapishka_2]